MGGTGVTVDRGLSEQEREILSDILTNGIRMPRGESVCSYEPLRARFPERAVSSLVDRGFLRELGTNGSSRISLNPDSIPDFWQLAERGVIVDLQPQVTSEANVLDTAFSLVPG